MTWQYIVFDGIFTCGLYAMQLPEGDRKVQQDAEMGALKQTWTVDPPDEI